MAPLVLLDGTQQVHSIACIPKQWRGL